jgi:hypothetical protein
VFVVSEWGCVRSSWGGCGGGTRRITATGVVDPDPADPDVAVDVDVDVFSDGVEAYITHCQLRTSSESISASAEQCCSSTKTRTRTFSASLKIGGLVVCAEG